MHAMDRITVKDFIRIDEKGVIDKGFLVEFPQLHFCREDKGKLHLNGDECRCHLLTDVEDLLHRV